MNTKLNKDFVVCCAVIACKYEHAQKKIIYQFVKDYFPFSKKETWHKWNYMRKTSYEHSLKDDETKDELFKEYSSKYKELFSKAESFLNEDVIREEIESGTLRKNSMKILTDKNATLNDVKIAKEKNATRKEMTESHIKEDSRTDLLEIRLIDEINKSDKITIIKRGKNDAFRDPSAARFIKDCIKVSYYTEDGIGHSMTIKVNNIISINETLKNKKYSLLVDDVLIIRDDNIIYFFEKGIKYENE